MNEPIQSCVDWEEAISLLAAGCLPPNEEPAIRRHLAACPACQVRFEQLTAVCARVQSARPDITNSAAELVSRVMSDIGRDGFSTAGLETRKAADRRVWAGAAVAASLLIFFVWWWRSPEPGLRPAPVVKHPQPKPMVLDIVEPESDQPTWFALQRAFAESEDAFEAELRRSSGALVRRDGDSVPTLFSPRDSF